MSRGIYTAAIRETVTITICIFICMDFNVACTPTNFRLVICPSKQANLVSQVNNFFSVRSVPFVKKKENLYVNFEK